MPIEIEGAPAGLPPRRWATVSAVEALTPRVRRITLSGDDLQGFELTAPGGHVKLILPPPGTARPAVPLRYEDRRAIFADGDVPPFLRTYTPLHFDAATLALEVDVLLHEGGMASDWATRVEVGDEIIVAGPRGGWPVPQDGAWYVVAADDTALPAAEQVLMEMPAGAAVRAYFEVVDAAEERHVPGSERAEALWLHRASNKATPGSCLEAALSDLDLPEGVGYAWVACEAGTMRRIRRRLLDGGLPADRMVTRGYWKLGVADHPDGDYGQDEIGHPH